MAVFDVICVKLAEGALCQWWHQDSPGVKPGELAIF